MAASLVVLGAVTLLHASQGASQPGAPHDVSAARARIVAAAQRHLGERYRGDCTDFVRRVYAEAGVAFPPLRPAASASESMFRSLSRVRRPARGDLVFFHRTYERDPPGPGANRFTHVGVVESVQGRRVKVIHRSGAGIQRLALNVARPADRGENGPLRRRQAGDRPRQPYLAGQLFAGYASPFAPAAARRPGRAAPGPSASRVAALQRSAQPR